MNTPRFAYSPVLDVWVVSRGWRLGEQMLWTFVSVCVCLVSFLISAWEDGGTQLSVRALPCVFAGLHCDLRLRVPLAPCLLQYLMCCLKVFN